MKAQLLQGETDWLEWGVTWGRHQSYNTLQDFRTGLGLDKESQVSDPEFANPLQPELPFASRTNGKAKDLLSKRTDSRRAATLPF